MKTYCKGLVIDREVVMRAYEVWRSKPAGNDNWRRVYSEYGSVDALVDEITTEIRERRLRFRPIHRFEFIEPSNGKPRALGVQSVKQQVVDYVIITCVEPLLDARVGYWQVSGIPGKGNDFAERAIQKWVRDGSCRYHVKSDVRHCYQSTDTGMVMGIFRKYVASDDVLYCIESVLSTYSDGLQMGSSFSQRASQLVLSFGYHHVEGMHKVRRGRNVALVSHQIWQADDIELFSMSKRDLRVAMRSLERFMADELGLTLKPWKICEVSEPEPVDLVGDQTTPSKTRVRGKTFLRARRSYRSFERHPNLQNARRVVSYHGVISHVDSKSLVKRNHMDRTAARARRLISRESRTSHDSGKRFRR